jgi:hypothetical protein
MTINQIIAILVAVGAISAEASAATQRDTPLNLSETQIRTLASILLDRGQEARSQQAVDIARSSEASLEIMALIGNTKKNRRHHKDGERSAECSVEILHLLKTVKAKQKPAPCPAQPQR